jgi:tRNA(Ile)-lysidine synthase
VPTASRNSKKPADPLLERLRHALAGIPKTSALLVGVSGGRDSMVLLHALKAAGFKNLVVCHLDHCLRGRESTADAKFVRRAAAKLGLPFESALAHTREYATANKKSLELAARELRYAFFQECTRRCGCRRLVLAHHADDQIETCLFNFLRGSGAAGLGGMRPHSKRDGLQILRPLLETTRAQIADWAKAHRIAFREDSSNAETAYTRNKLRLRVLPEIEKAVGPTFRAAILRAADILRSEDAWMDSLVPKPCVQLACRELRAMHPALASRFVLRWLRESGIEEPGWRETRAVLSLIEAESPAKVNLPGGFHARRRAGAIFLEKGAP